MKKYLKSLILGLSIVFMSSCEFDLQKDPNTLTPEQADIDFLLNNVQFSLQDVFNRSSVRGMDVTRMVNMGGSTYENAYTASTFNLLWQGAYADLLVDAKLVVDQATVEGADLFYHAGVAQVIRAYTYMLLVDMFGEIPYSEALDPNILSPKADAGADVYAGALQDLNDAIANFGKTSFRKPGSDLYYDGDETKWIKLANTLKLKLLLQTRLVDNSVAGQIDALVSAGNLMSANDDAFAFNYGTVGPAPESRHPDFTNNYLAGATEYMANHYMNYMYNSHTTVDPRMRYYFYRQSLAIPTDVTILDCISKTAPPHYASTDVFCFVGDGYWGRDHIDADGIPPDTQLRTTYGVYPAGGEFDGNDGLLVTASSGAQGKGIQPYMMPSYVQFMLAEAALEIGVSGDARTYLENGIRGSIDYVMNFGTQSGIISTADAAFVPSATEVDDFVNEILSDYDAADATGKLDIIAKEYWVALFGNGIESYNMYRRTGHPANMQPGLESDAGEFYRTFIYPANFVTRNASVDQKAGNTVQVFWDNNPAGFIN